MRDLEIPNTHIPIDKGFIDASQIVLTWFSPPKLNKAFQEGIYIYMDFSYYSGAHPRVQTFVNEYLWRWITDSVQTFHTYGTWRNLDFHHVSFESAQLQVIEVFFNLSTIEFFASLGNHVSHTRTCVILKDIL